MSQPILAKNKWHIYTHSDRQEMLWRFDGSRPVSMLADMVMSATRGERYFLSRAGPCETITCLKCNHTSSNPEDVQNLWCDVCKEWMA